MRVALLSISMIQIKKNFPLKKFTAMAMGGPARSFVTVRSEKELLDGLNFAKSKKLLWYMVGEGSNLIAADGGYRGVIVRNQIQRFDLSPSLFPSPGKRRSKKITPLQAMERGKGRGRTIIVGAGDNLLKLIFKLDNLGLAGLEKMAGIPGTVGGAIYGCAGAYGQEIKDNLVGVRFFDGRKFRNLTNKQCRFGYRESIFKKHQNWIITEATFKLRVGERSRLLKTSREIIKFREKKYLPGLRCPGSFFKNIKLADLKPLKKRQTFLKKIPRDKIMYSKVPTGYLLEQVNAKGLKQGSVIVAKHHANLIYNPNGGKAADVKKLANKLKKLVKNKFGIIIEEEVQYLE